MEEKIGAGKITIISTIIAGIFSVVVALIAVPQSVKSNLTNKEDRLGALQNKLDSLENKVKQTEEIFREVPVGTIFSYTGTVIPEGFKKCDGMILNSDKYPELFKIIGTTFGKTNVDGSFGLPDLSGRAVIGVGTYSDPVSGSITRNLGETIGAERHKLSESEMPKHRHQLPTFDGQGGQDEVGSGHYGKDWIPQEFSEYSGNDVPHNNMQPSLALYFIIKVK